MKIVLIRYYLLTYRKQENDPEHIPNQIPSIEKNLLGHTYINKYILKIIIINISTI